MKKIGFVDYFISEWHANNYPAWIEEACLKKGVDYKVAYCWAEVDVSETDRVTTDEWCAKYGVEKCESLDELCEKSDVIVILAPKTPEVHLRYAETVLRYGKRTYIDKTFAPNIGEANQIFALGKKYGTPFFSTSALRYATELDAIDSPESMMVLGGGSNLPEYFIHLGEMVTKKMGMAKSVTAHSNGTQTILRAKMQSGRYATMIYGRSMKYVVYMTEGEKEIFSTVTSPFFEGLISDMIDFFETGSPSFDVQETKAVIRLRDAALKALESPDTEIEV